VNLVEQLAAQRENKIALVRAHREKDWELARVLSQRRERLKIRKNPKRRYVHVRLKCVDCGLTIKRGLRCKMHATFHQYHRHAFS
jgi:hypothetical protein